MRGTTTLFALLLVSVLVAGCGSTLREGPAADDPGRITGPGALVSGPADQALAGAGPATEMASTAGVARDNPVRTYIHIKGVAAKWSDAEYRAAAQRYNMATLNVPLQKKISLLKGANPNMKVMLYYLSTGVFADSAETWQEINKHDDWFVHDAQGRRIQWKAEGWYLLNVSNSGYRQWVAQRVKSKAAQLGFDGVYLDRAGFDVQETSDGAWTSPVPAAVRNNWFDWVAGFIAYVQNNIGSLTVVYNTLEWNPGGYNRTSDSPHLDKVKAANMEGFVHPDWRTGALSDDLSRSIWEYQLRRAKEVIGKGKIFWAQPGVKQSATTAEQLQRIQGFALGTYLLVADGSRAHMTFVSEPDGAVDETLYISAYDTALGSPSGAYTQVGAAYVRVFTKGQVVVNPDDSKTVTVSLGATYKTAGGASVTSVTLKPKTAVIVTR